MRDMAVHPMGSDVTKSYLAGCVIVGAAIEAMLRAMIHIYVSEVEAAGTDGKDKERKRAAFTMDAE